MRAAANSLARHGAMSMVAAVMVAGLAALLLSGAAPSGIADAELRSALARAPGWNETFASRPAAPEWIRGYSPWPETIGNRILLNGEVQVYIDKPYLNRDLLEWKPGQVRLVAERMTPADRAAIDARIAREKPSARAAAALGNATWVSTLLKSSRSFQYGYIEAEISSDLDPSAWPAFWMLPAKWGWPPEIDILEIPGDRIAHQTLHSLPGDPPPHPTVRTQTGPAFHSYGMLWRPDFIRFFIDRKPTACFRTPADMHQPMYPLLNLAVGGWAKAPGRSTPARLVMDVRTVRWWPLPEASAAAGAAAPPGCAG